VNATITALEPAAKRYLLTEAEKEVDRVFDGEDDVVAGWSVELARDAAWAHGGVVWRLRDEPLILDPYVDALDRSAWVLAKMLLVPTARSGIL
jgi:hypothetical protein